MTPEQFAKARKRLGLNLEQMAAVLGFDGKSAHSQIIHMEAGRRSIKRAYQLLIEAYLAGYRPKEGWPKS